MMKLKLYILGVCKILFFLGCLLLFRTLLTEEEMAGLEEEVSSTTIPQNMSSVNYSNTSLQEHLEEVDKEENKPRHTIFNKCKTMFQPTENSSFYFKGPTFTNASKSYERVSN